MALRFSERIGETPLRTALQSEGMDCKLRSRIWNCVMLAFLEEIGAGSVSDTVTRLFFRRMWHNFFGAPTDTLHQEGRRNVRLLRDWFFNEATWATVYDLIEYLATEPEDARDVYSREHLGSPRIFVKICNGVLEEEMSAYRIVQGQVMKITDEQEIAAVEAALNQHGPWSVPAKHIGTSAAHLFNRETPDYQNAVKEAICAVESACCLVANRKATLGDALDLIEKKHPLHPAFKVAFDKLYGYASDAGGIRHGSISLASVNFEDAKYMLVACSAFVNYLKGISAQQ